jgi:hypothetical protein
MTEEAFQRAVAMTLDAMGWLWCHVPNGGARDARTGAKLKGQGVRRGVPDVMVFERWARTYSGPDTPICDDGFGVAIELKAGRRKPTGPQKAWMDGLRERGWMVDVCRTMDEVLDVLRHVRPMNGRRIT